MNEILSQSIFFGIAITLVTYEIGLWIKQRPESHCQSLTDLRNPDRGSIVIVPYRL